MLPEAVAREKASLQLALDYGLPWRISRCRSVYQQLYGLDLVMSIRNLLSARRGTVVRVVEKRGPLVLVEAEFEAQHTRTLFDWAYATAYDPSLDANPDDDNLPLDPAGTLRAIVHEAAFK